MSTRRIILLILLVIPAGFIIAAILKPLSTSVEIIALVFSCPIAALNAWESQSPETLDELIPRGKS